MRILFYPTLAVVLLTFGCSQAQNEKAADVSSSLSGKKHKKASHEDRLVEAAVPGLRRLGELEGVHESSGLALADQPSTYYTMGDDGNPPVLYKVDDTGKLLEEIKLNAPNVDWESLTRDQSGNLFVTDAGNNNNDRRDLTVYRVNPLQPQTVGAIHFTYPDQQEFPPKKKQRNFDCEASAWHEGRLYLFTKDRAQQTTSKVYSLPDEPGTYTAKLVTQLAIPGEVTDATFSPDGHQLVLMARQEMFVFSGNTLPELLKSKPRRVELPGAGQTEGVLFLDAHTLLISSEQGSLYRYQLQ